MSDFNSSLPVRTENAGDVAAKIVDGTTPSQQLTVNVDGSINVTDNGDSLTVDQSVHDNLNVNANLQVADTDVGNANPVPVSDAGGSLTVDAVNLDVRDLAFATDKIDVTGSDVTATVSATDLDIRDLTFATDKIDASGSEVSLDSATLAALESVTVQNGAGAAAVNIQDGGNSITVDATNLDIRDLVFATDKVDVSGSSVTVTATDLDIRDLTHSSDSVKVGDGTDFLAINSDGSINVVLQEDTGTETVNFDSQASLASGATDNQDLVFATASKLYQVWASASGKLKITVQIETAAGSNTFDTVVVGFNSTALPNIDLKLAKYAAIPAGARVRVIRQNNDNQAQDVYSTIVGILG